jgi:hypothetical protein
MSAIARARAAYALAEAAADPRDKEAPSRAAEITRLWEAMEKRPS